MALSIFFDVLSALRQCCHRDRPGAANLRPCFHDGGSVAGGDRTDSFRPALVPVLDRAIHRIVMAQDRQQLAGGWSVVEGYAIDTWNVGGLQTFQKQYHYENKAKEHTVGDVMSPTFVD